MPFALKLLDQEITAFTCTGFRYVTERSVGRLKENMLEWSQGGGGVPTQDPIFVKAATAGLDLQETSMPSDAELPGPAGEILHAQALSSEANHIIEPKVGGEASVNAVDNLPITQHEFLKQHGGGPASVDSVDNLPITQHEFLKQHGGTAPVNAVDPKPTEHRLEEEWVAPQSGGEPVGFEAPSTAEQASLNSAIKGTDLGGAAPVSQLGTDIDTSAFYEPARGEPTFTIPNPFTSPPIQKGGSPGPAVTEGTTIDQETFSEPSRGEPTFTVPNPYTSPPLPIGTTVLPGPQATVADATSTFEVPKALLAELGPTVQQGGGDKKIVFDDEEIKVVRFE